MLPVLGIFAAVLLLAAAALWVAILVNGPAVLDAVDRSSGGARNVELVESAPYGTQPTQKLRYYAPADTRNRLPVLIFFHGGSWQSGDPDNYGFIARALAPEGFIVVVAGYRLGEEGRYPAMLQDTAAAIAQVRSDVGRFGGDPDRIVLSGHSAGAYNVVQVAVDQRWLHEAGVPQSSIKGVAGLSGPYDFYPFASEATKLMFGTVGAGPESQPINHARSNLAPMLLIHGEDDTLVKPRNTHALAAAISEAGARVETQFYPEMDHNKPLISLASPWRDSAGIAVRIAKFAHRVTDVSVPVQAERP